VGASNRIKDKKIKGSTAMNHPLPFTIYQNPKVITPKFITPKAFDE